MKTDLIRLYENREDVTLTCYLGRLPGAAQWKEASRRVNLPRRGLSGLLRPGRRACGPPVRGRWATMPFVLRYSTYTEGKNGPVDCSVPFPQSPA